MPAVSLPGSFSRRPRRSSTAVAAALIRRSVGALSAGRHTCRHCHRTPLVGEMVYLYAKGAHDEEIVCELCRPLRVAQPDRTLLVRPAEQAGAVRTVPRAT
jgi:hypothetical protein